MLLCQRLLFCCHNFGCICIQAVNSCVVLLLVTFYLFDTGAELESQSTDSHLLAECLHAGCLPERDGGPAHPQIPPDYLLTDSRGVCVCVVVVSRIFLLSSHQGFI